MTNHLIDHIDIRTEKNGIVIIPGEDVLDYFETGWVLWRLISFYVSSEKYDSALFQSFKYCEIEVFFKLQSDQNFEGIIHVVIPSSTSKDGKGIISLSCQDFTFQLMEHIEEMETKYEKGYGEVIQKLVEPIDFFNLNEICHENISGKLYLNDVTLNEAIKHLAYLRGWDFKINGKKIIFCPAEKTIQVIDTEDYQTVIKDVKFEH